jgi:hypothetical protein
MVSSTQNNALNGRMNPSKSKQGPKFVYNNKTLHKHQIEVMILNKNDIFDQAFPGELATSVNPTTGRAPLD